MSVSARSMLAVVLVAGCGDSATQNPDGFIPPGSLDDFPEAPILDGNAPKGAPGLFGGSDGGAGGAGPCLLDPEPDALFPRNWLRMRVHFQPAPGQNLFEIRLHAEAEKHDLVVYTQQTTWTMPGMIWSKITDHLADQPFTVTVRGAAFDGTRLTTPPAASAPSEVRIAPAAASGAIVYWTTSGGSALKGFSIGDESVRPVLSPGQVKSKTATGADVTCVGCHTSTPDGLYAGLTTQDPWGNVLASIDTATVGAAPPFLTPGGAGALAKAEIGIHTFSRAHWSQGDHVEVAPFGEGPTTQLAWFDLEAKSSDPGTGYGFLARTGDTRGAGAPTWSHEGSTIVYVSTDVERDGRLDSGDADLYAVAYNNRNGGMAKPLNGASDPALEEFYPAFSADDQLLAFDRVPKGNTMYNQAKAEVFVINATGGTPTRLAANDPAACSGVKSPGVTNSWPKWSPETSVVGNRTYYWLTFSSTRGERMNPQLYVTAVVVTRGEALLDVKTHAALYLWNQPEMENNHTPAWDVFQIPPG
jgi:hypothetical protein